MVYAGSVDCLVIAVASCAMAGVDSVTGSIASAAHKFMGVVNGRLLLIAGGLFTVHTLLIAWTTDGDCVVVVMACFCGSLCTCTCRSVPLPTVCVWLACMSGLSVLTFTFN